MVSHHRRMTPEVRQQHVPRPLQFRVHCDGHDKGFLITHEPVCPSHTCGIHLALRAMANMSDVELVWQAGGGVITRKTSNDTSALVALDELLRSDEMLERTQGSYRRPSLLTTYLLTYLHAAYPS